MVYFIFAVAIVMNAVANILMKVGMKDKKMTEVSFNVVLHEIVLNPVVIAGVACFGVALLSYSYVLSKFNLSVAYPIMTSVGFVIVLLVSWLFIKEDISFVQIIGIALIMAGVWLTSMNLK